MLTPIITANGSSPTEKMVAITAHTIMAYQKKPAGIGFGAPLWATRELCTKKCGIAIVFIRIDYQGSGITDVSIIEYVRFFAGLAGMVINNDRYY